MAEVPEKQYMKVNGVKIDAVLFWLARCECKEAAMCAAYIIDARSKMRPIKSLHLRPKWYRNFRNFIAREQGEEKMYNEDGSELKFCLDGVNVELGSKYQSKDIAVDYYE